MTRHKVLTWGLMMTATLTVAAEGLAQINDVLEAPVGRWANERDRELAGVLARREADWRVGPIVYQVFVDRFAPPTSKRLEAKRHFYEPPRSLAPWNQTPVIGKILPDLKLWSHELEFWGGDLPSLMTRIDYIESLGVDVLYLNPINDALTNHKYDVHDYFSVAPEYGTRDDVIALADDLHARGMKLMLDGVFNHMGVKSPAFKQAMADPTSPWRDWFYIGDQYPLGFRAWANIPLLAEVNLENPQVRAVLYGDPDSVVQGFLRDGVDGWRLDTAFELGFVILEELTHDAHEAKPGSAVIGEAWNYPEEWVQTFDGIMNFFLRDIIFAVVEGKVSGRHAGVMIERMVEDAGIEPLLRSWILLDNHDLARLANRLPDRRQRRIAQVLQFTLPGAPLLYYGTELGMTGKGDPECRAPMRWDLVVDDNPELSWVKKLIKMRKQHRALRIGEFRLLDTESLFAFQRTTDHAGETVIVLVNPTDEPVSEIIATRNAKLMSYSLLEDVLTDAQTRVFAGLLTVEVPPHTVHVFTPVIDQSTGYSAYGRVQ